MHLPPYITAVKKINKYTHIVADIISGRLGDISAIMYYSSCSFTLPLAITTILLHVTQLSARIRRKITRAIKCMTTCRNHMANKRQMLARQREIDRVRVGMLCIITHIHTHRTSKI